MRTGTASVRLIVLLCLLNNISLSTSAQSISAGEKIELGLNIGPSFFLGDLGGNRGTGKTFIKDVNIPVTRLMKGIYVNFYPTEWFGFRLAGNLGVLEGYDSLVKSDGINELERKKRNLGFRAKMREVYLALEIYPTVFLEQYDGLEGKLRPYGVAGFGYFHYNPKAQYTNPNGSKEWVELKPLRLEGQGMAEYPDRKEYSLNQYAIVMGGGFKYYVRENFYVGLEILHRKCFTDYLDDVSTQYIDPYYFDVYLTPDKAAQARQLAYREKFYNPNINRPYIDYQRGDPKENDAFFSGMLRLGIRLNGANSPNARARRQLKCPVFY
jgi:hypothetical protein